MNAVMDAIGSVGNANQASAKAKLTYQSNQHELKEAQSKLDDVQRKVLASVQAQMKQEIVERRLKWDGAGVKQRTLFDRMLASAKAEEKADQPYSPNVSITENGSGSEANALAPNDRSGIMGEGTQGKVVFGAEGAESNIIYKIKVDEIINTPKGSRPDPVAYLGKEYIAGHLSKFQNGVTKIVAQAPSGTAGPPSGTFVMPLYIADELIAKARGNVLELEQLLGLQAGSLGTNPVRIDIAHPTGLRLPSGNELGANSQWIPGGYTSGGLLEAIIDPPIAGQYVVTSIN